MPNGIESDNPNMSVPSIRDVLKKELQFSIFAGLYSPIVKLIFFYYVGNVPM